MAEQQNIRQTVGAKSMGNAHDKAAVGVKTLPASKQFGFDPEAIQLMAKAHVSGLAERPPPNNPNNHNKVVQGQFIVNGDPKTGDALNTWIDTYVAKPEVEAIIRKWAGDVSNTTNHETDVKALEAAKKAAVDTIAAENTEIGELIQADDEPNAASWGDYPVWSAWYFPGLEYQDNKTGGWHSNRKGLLPGDATDDGAPTRYVEFRRPGAVGTKEKDKMERCIFDLISRRCWPNAHYDGGYVEITNIPAGVTKRLFDIAFESTGLKEKYGSLSATKKTSLGTDKAVVIQWLIDHLNDKDEEADD